MRINQPPIDPTKTAELNGRNRVRDSGQARNAAGPTFRNALSNAATGATGGSEAVTVRRGDTLLGLTRNYLGQGAAQFSSSQLYDMAKTIARDSGIANPDKIMPGQSVNLASLAPMSTMAALKMRQPLVESVQLNSAAGGIPTPMLDKTLARAAAKGYLGNDETAAVREKIMTLANRHHFAPDDFAKLTLMESDGMNPRASNGNCHGIIQFCDGTNRGAASAGYGSNPKAILNLSVMQQLDLVDNYFEETRLKDRGPASLDDLYLTVLTPAARNETRADAPLNIAGRQAAHLYEGRDQNGIITRNSIVAGLKQNARDRLGDFSPTIAQAEDAGR
jgi:hypothetical protein